MSGSRRASTERPTLEDKRQQGKPRAPGQDTSPFADKPKSPNTATFADGDVVAGRYRIVKQLSRGGMGEVYEVEDLELRERVALKTILPDLAGDSRHTDRFKREAQLARRVTHPNVCRLFDVGTHGDGDHETVFLTMELLTGETLATRVRRGRMTAQEALPIVQQICAGLAATHECGIVHRDLKTDNVLLVSGGTNGLRAVITDFGIARGNGGVDRFAKAVTRTGEFIGSPHYMAPEQVEGEDDITPAADIYALGVVMYEMVTGTLPFEGTTDYAIAAKRLTQAPPSPRERATDLDVTWEKVILTCLEREVGDRFATVGEVAAALDGGRIPETRHRAPAAPAKKKPRGPAMLVIGALVLGGAAAGITALVVQHEKSGPKVAELPAPRGARRAIAVIAPRDRSPHDETRWVGVALGEWLRAELSAGEQVRLAPPDETDELANDMHLAVRDPSEGETVRLRDALVVDALVTGAYTLTNEYVSVDVQLAGGDPIHVEGTTADLPAIARQLAAPLREQLGATELSAADRKATDAAEIAPIAVATPYARGVELLRHGDPLGARQALEAASEADPSRALPLAALARAQQEIGNEHGASEAAQQAVAVDGTLPRALRLEIEGLAAMATGEYGKASEIYRSLWTFFPDELAWGIALYWAQSKAGNTKDREETIAELAKRPAPARDDVRIAIADADLAEDEGNFKRELEIVRALLPKFGVVQNDRWARAKSQEGWALKELNEHDGALAAFGELEKYARAKQDMMLVAGALTNKATVLRHMGKNADAERALEEATGLYEQAGAVAGMYHALNMQAIIAAERGDIAGAQHQFERAEAACMAGKQPSCQAIAALNIAAMMQQRGELGDAKARVESALDLARQLGDKHLLGNVLETMAGILVDRAELDDARRRYLASLDAREAIGDKIGAATVKAELALVRVYDGKAVEAEAAAALAAADLESAEAWDNLAFADTVLAQARLAQKKVAEARTAAAAALAATVKGEDKATRLRAQIVDIVVAKDAPRLAAVRAEAEAAGLVNVAFEARLAAAELAGPKARAELAKEARAAGFEMVARRAAK